LRLAHFFVLDNVFRSRICSHEHENKFAAFVVTVMAQIHG